MVDSIMSSGQHAADLIGQLLAFSRKQLIEPKVLDVNKIVTEMEKMLQPIIGENTRVEIKLTPDLWPIKADPIQLEQVIANLAVNARDAMPDGGQLTIETANAILDQTYPASHFELQPGEYVLLAISDTGCGMNEKTKAHIFEPFFTTKEGSKGTGLGLATVYGIVKQNNGDIQVYSEEGVGTTFKTYFPRTGERAPESTPRAEAELPSGNETILLVEDAAGVRELAYLILDELGYTILEASNGEDALRVSAQYTEPIHLLLTDVIMPEINGKVLADKLLKARPDLKVLFMSGYTDDAIARHGVLDPDVAFIQKPLSVATLARKVRDVLDN
jgi:CheY-like chemotaxis protein